MAYELVTIGRISVDIYPEQIGLDIEDVTSFGKYVGGSATNVAIAAARYGRRTALVTKTGADPFGNYLRRELATTFGVDTSFIGTDPALLTPVTFCAIKPPEDFPLYFYRSPSAPDLQITPAEVSTPPLLDAITDAQIYWSTVTGLSQEPSCAAHLAAWQHRVAGAGTAAGKSSSAEPRYTVLDLDYRPMFWPDVSAARDAVAEALPYVDVLVGNREECAVAVGDAEPDVQADRLLERGARIAVVKMGSHGVLAATADQRVVCPPVTVDVVNGLGAGDAFGGALCHGLLAGWPLERTLQFANAAGATVAGRIACSSAMPTADEVESLLAERGLTSLTP